MKNAPRYNRERLLSDAERFEESGNYKMAAEMLLRGAKLGSDSCQLNLGNYYADGTGVRRDLGKAAHWYKNAYKNGNSWGAFNLAIDKRNNGDLRSAERWFKKAIAMRHGGAHLQLAKMYLAQCKEEATAHKLLRQVIRMSRDNASSDEKAEAESLLRGLRSSPARSKELVARSRRAQSKSSTGASKPRGVV
jgi:TPR repeat protein